MRILFVDTTPIRRGAQVFVQELSSYLDAKCHCTQRLYLFQLKEDLKLTLRGQDFIFPFQEDSLLEKIPSFQPQLLRSLWKEIQKFKPDVILLNGSKTLKYGAWLKILKKNEGAKLIGRFIDDAVYWNQGGIKKRMYSYWIDQLDGLIGVSQSSLDSAIKHYSFKKSSKVIHRVFDTHKFAHSSSREESRRILGLSEADEVLLFLGNLTAQKRPDRFIEIISQLSKSRPKLKALIVGNGELGVAIQSQISNLKSQMLFYSYQQDVSPYLASADLLILTSDTEGLPGVVLEAAYFSVSTIASEVGGIKECLINGETGFLIPDRSVNAFCEKIDFLLDNPEKRILFGQNARTFISQNFQMEQVATQYLDFFESALKI